MTANAEAILDRFGEVYGRVGARWNAYLDTLTDEQLAFANDLFARAAEVNREEIERLRSALMLSSPRPQGPRLMR